MITLDGYKFIKGKTILRPWGHEYRFTAADDTTGREFNEVVLLKTGKEDDEQISSSIQALLDRINVAPEPDPRTALEDDIATLEAQKSALEDGIATLEAQKSELEKDVK